MMEAWFNEVYFGTWIPENSTFALKELIDKESYAPSKDMKTAEVCHCW